MVAPPLEQWQIPGEIMNLAFVTVPKNAAWLSHSILKVTEGISTTTGATTSTALAIRPLSAAMTENSAVLPTV